MQSLAHYLTYDDKHGLSAFFNVFPPLCEYVAQRHRQGDVVASLSPETIYIDPQTGAVEVRSTHEEVNQLLPYISPEQTGRLSRAVDQRSDLYSLGVIFYEILTGTLPFQAEDALGWIYAHLSSTPQPPHLVDPEVPQALSEIVMKLLAKSPDDRYHSISALQADLTRCQREWERTGTIKPFLLGKADLYRHLVEQREIFGRDREMAVLAAAYMEAKQGRSQAVLVSGYPGIGKTALIGAFRTTICGGTGFFLYGKCPQIMGDVPYTPVLEAVSILVRQVLIRGQRELDYWKRRLRQALGRLGGVLTEIVPELAFLTGKFPAVPAVPPKDAERRLQAAFAALLEVFAHGKEPLVLFIDDLQWIDPASLNLVTSLVRETRGSLLFIGAYRSNTDWAVEKAGPFAQTLSEAGVAVRHLHLEPLTSRDIEQLVRSILGDQTSGIEALVAEVSRRSGGVPLYIKQFLLNLYSIGTLTFSSDQLAWQYDGARAEEPAAWGEDVIDLVLERIKQVPVMTIEILKFAACLGRWFPLDTLAAALKQPVGSIKEHLQPALELGIIVKNTYPDPGAESGSYEFAHDRVAEAVYSLLTEEERKLTHLKAGRAILDSRSSALEDSELFAAVDHLNYAVDLLEDQEQRLLLAEYNLKAATRARASAAFRAALLYSETGIKLLPPDHWDTHYELSLSLYTSLYWCKFLLEGYESAEPIFQLLTAKARTAEDRITLYNDKATLATGYYSDEEAVRSGLEALKLLGLRVPMRPKKSYLIRELLHTQWLLRGRTPESLLNLPAMTDRWALQTVATLANLIPPATVFDAGLFVSIVLHMLKVTLQYGNSAYSAFAFASYGFICAAQLNAFYKAAGFQRAALAMASQYGDDMSYMAYYMIANYLNHWHKPLWENLDYEERAFQLADENGDVLFAGAAQVEMVLIRYVLGDSLQALDRQIETALAANIRYGMPDLLDILQTAQQYIKNLQGQTVSATSFTDREYDENAVSKRMIKTDSAIIVPFYYLMKIRSLYLHGAYREAWDFVLTLYRKREAMIGKISRPEFAYWVCLTAAAVLPQLTEDQKRQAEKLMKRELKHLRRWSRACEDNFLHKFKLASAEHHRLRGKRQRAFAEYEEAISGALVQGCTLDAAIACELAGKLYLEVGFEQNKRAHFDSAYRLYDKYGAVLKAKEMQERYGAVSESLETAAAAEEPAAYPQAAETLKLAQPAHHYSLQAAEVAERIAEKADLLALTEAVESLSTEQDLYGVVARLMEIIAERAGAERVYLLAAFGEELAVIAAKESGDRPRVFAAGPLPDQAESNGPPAALKGYSEGIIRYAIHSGTPVIVDDVEKDPLFADYSFDSGYTPKSVLCLALPSQGGPTPVLYLDNNRTAYAFSEQLVGLVRRLTELILQVLSVGGKALRSSQGRAAASKEGTNTVTLTEKESEILNLIGAGLSNAEIAQHLQIAEGTVKWHTNKLFRKLGVETRTQAVLRAAELGLLKLEQSPKEPRKAH